MKNMLTYKERIGLRDKLISGEIGIDFAKELYWKNFKEGKKSWYTKDWKERRDKLIKEKCQVCGGKETLTLQHLTHPRKFSEYLTEVRRIYTKDYIDTNPVIDKTEFINYIREKYEYYPVAFCPKCKWSNPSMRVRKVPKYRCLGCKHEFDTPVYIQLDALVSIFIDNKDALEVRDKSFVSKQWNNMHNLSSVRYWMQRELKTSNDSLAIEKEAFLLYLNDDIRYLSFEDTITACRKCAFEFDIKKMELCPICKENYKSFQYPTCIQCLPEERRKSVLESLEFAKRMRDMHKDLGID